MREAIERVIADLESDRRYAWSIGSNRGFGMAQAYGVAIHKLKEVLNSDSIPIKTER